VGYSGNHSDFSWYRNPEIKGRGKPCPYNRLTHNGVREALAPDMLVFCGAGNSRASTKPGACQQASNDLGYSE
jgi:hypothetical protein